MLGLILRWIALAAGSAVVGDAVNALIDRLMNVQIGGNTNAVLSTIGGNMPYFADSGGGGSTFWGPGPMGPAQPRKKRRRRARLTQGELTELMNIKNLLGKTAAANVLPFYMGRGR